MSFILSFLTCLAESLIELADMADPGIQSGISVRYFTTLVG